MEDFLGDAGEQRREKPAALGRRHLKTAAALSYNLGDEAPRVVAAGEGRTAMRIIESAEAAGIPVVEDGTLSSLLYGLPPGALIPENAYRAAAAVFAFVERKKRKKRIERKKKNILPLEKVSLT